MEKKKLLFWENWTVFAGIALFVRSVLTQLAKKFNHDVDTLINNGIPADMINQYQDQYNHFWNGIFPIAAAGLFMYMAWVVFHYYALPRLLKKPSELKSLLLLILSIFLVFNGSWLYFRYRLYWDLMSYDLDYADSFYFIQKTRNVYVLATTIIGMWLIFLYEILSQAFYMLSERFRREGPMYGLLINFMFTTAVMIFLILMSELGTSLPFKDFRSYQILPLIMGVPLVLNQGILYQNLIRQKAVNILLSALFIVLSICFFSALFNEVINYALHTQYLPFFNRLRNQLPEVALLSLSAAGISIVLAGIRYFIFRRNNKLETQVSVKSAELDQLRAQVNPHFLFNALNTLYSVSLKENAEITASGIQKLGDMMRFMLNENHQEFISLSKEVEQLENYIVIQRMRLDESQNIHVHVNIQTPESEIMISPMLLNPFVENAFKHGISFRNPSWIHITLTYDSENLYFKVHNSLHKMRDTDTEKYSNGIGLENVKKRLELLYPKRHNLEIEQSEQDFFVSLRIQYR